MTSAAGVTVSTVPDQGTGAGSTPSATLQSSQLFGPKDIVLKPIPHRIARKVCEQEHYLRSYPGGPMLAFGAFVGARLLGVAVLGVGPKNISFFFRDAQGKEVLCLSRLWLDDRLGRNSESHTLAVILRLLRRYQTTVKTEVAYSDPAAGHTGMIYRGAGFLYSGESQATPLYRLPDGTIYHSRSLSHAYGSHSVKHFAAQGVVVELVPQSAKHTYIALVDPSWRDRLVRPVLPYLKEEIDHGDC